jgi:hypothetical protein
MRIDFSIQEIIGRLKQQKDDIREQRPHASQVIVWQHWRRADERDNRRE